MTEGWDSRKGGGPIPVLMGPDGRTPMPPHHLLKALKQVDDRLDVQWWPEQGKWAVIEHWHPADRRWPLYRRRVIGAAFDLFMYLPENVDPDTVIDHVLAQVLRGDKTKAVNRHRLKKIREMQAHNQRVSEQARARAQEPVVAEVEYQARRIVSDPGAIAREEGVGLVYRDRRSGRLMKEG